MHVWWLGQSGFLLGCGGRHLLVDPYLSDSLTRKYAGSDRPHVRMTRRVVAPERLAFVDAVASTHGHTDHLDPDTLRALRPRVLVCPARIAELARERSGVEATGLEEGGTVEVAGFALTAVPADHDGPGPAYGYVIRVGGRCVYHSGDTLVFAGMGELLRPFELDLALLPINGKVGNMSGPEAARLAHEAGAALAVPCHYELFEFNTASPEPFARECERLGQPYRLLRAGERLTL